MPLVTPETVTPSTGQGFVPEQSRAERTRSFTPSDFSVPHGREEDWRFTPVDRLGDFFAEGEACVPPQVPTDLPEGVTASIVTLEEARELGAQPGGDRAAAVTASRAGAVLRIDIPADVDVTEPIRVPTVGQGQAVFSHLLVTAGRHSRARLVLRHTGSARLGSLVSIVTGDGADLSVVSLQEWDDDAVHLAQHDVVVGRDASVRHIAVSLSGKIVRVNTNATYAGTGGRFEGLGVYFADAGQHLEHRLYVDHSEPHCYSNVEYKGALQGEEAHTVWVGDVLIRAAAEGTETYEMNRNLVLTDGPRADSVPNLEIETGEIVGAGHASTTGRFDDEQLFYLMSRGIAEDEARRMIVHAFFAEVIKKIGIDEVVDRLTAAIEVELEASARIKAEQESQA
ncbi:Fe-S cluster assembly protein SufD [Dermatophilus congolensis]|uniref:Fe-S cluster assembly protein SufD n=1 Tax=Dermatophilus congolensis TaxID=1863 RepID=UPI001AAF8F88|nr:Fe-S cluster assembly protein SufD [Dermatophilus congolensis]MBO3142902.1 Fe-S cluster assembly protein SufD [Dermatophilus congolensis]MBO3151893.1 Fe-S cluster assembly protein SufD [Dermatophilus congolensis]MBO3161101.1 Fe-S cluster assembly protein SufD [Dermatophilus congolensis]MBO3163175.1 Fe-S cluster assembly protein SufD [Dermatophilus congolensis]MBO3176732.1 Fe-S cluster assembly protein SufD [Dermatophilus congolensis]